MSTTLAVNPIAIAIPWVYDKTGYPGSSLDNNSQTYVSSALTNGVAAGNANIKYSTQLTIAPSSTDTIDLSSLIDSLGNTISFARIKAIYIENSNTTTSSEIKVGGAGSNAFDAIWDIPGTANSDAVVYIRNGAIFFVGVAADATGYVVGTNTDILITNEDATSGHNATVNIVIIGCDA